MNHPYPFESQSFYSNLSPISFDLSHYAAMDAKCTLGRDRKSLIPFYPDVSLLFYLFASNRALTCFLPLDFSYLSDSSSFPKQGLLK